MSNFKHSRNHSRRNQSRKRKISDSKVRKSNSLAMKADSKRAHFWVRLSVRLLTIVINMTWIWHSQLKIPRWLSTWGSKSRSWRSVSGIKIGKSRWWTQSIYLSCRSCTERLKLSRKWQIKSNQQGNETPSSRINWGTKKLSGKSDWPKSITNALIKKSNLTSSCRLVRRWRLSFRRVCCHILRATSIWVPSNGNSLQP